jgi:hypothetical protein
VTCAEAEFRSAAAAAAAEERVAQTAADDEDRVAQTAAQVAKWGHYNNLPEDDTDNLLAGHKRAGK